MTENVYESPTAELQSEDRQIAILTRAEILFSFKGRIGRQTYWLNYLGMMVIFSMIFFALIWALGGQTESPIFSIMTLVLYIPIIWISFALTVKRWHDRNKSGWWLLIIFVPLIGPIWSFIENGCLAGDVESNNYGAPTF
jgi:uncharacterized membrane protein YhaH (DUF805 family)